MSRHPHLACALLAPLLMGAQAPEGAPQAGLSIRIVEGDGAINSIRLKRAHNPVAQVLDPSGEPLAGATVTFILPATGPSGVFQGSGLSYTTSTNDRGIAAARGLTPNRLEGPFRIRVTASGGGQAASATLTQTNAEPVISSGRTKKILILALIAGGVVGGVAAAAGGSGNSNGAGQQPGGSTGGGSIVAGLPSVGPPP